MANYVALDLENRIKTCGSCAYCSNTEILVSKRDLETLKTIAGDILKLEFQRGNRGNLRIVGLLALGKQLTTRKVKCRKENVWTHFLDDACYAWTPRASDAEFFT